VSEVCVRVLAGDEHFALPVSGVLSISELGEVAPVPGGPPELLGVRNLRGRVIPVIDLATMLGISDETDRKWIVVSELDGLHGGFAVTEIVDVGELGDATEEADSPYLSGAILVDGALVGVVDLAVILNALSPAAA
jgi:chemotaxis signal transduction protein